MRSLLVVALVVASMAPAVAAQPAPTAGAATPTPAADISVVMKLQTPVDQAGKPLPLKLGDQVVATFEIEAPVDAKVFPPSPPNFGAAFKRMANKPTRTRGPETAGRVTEQHAWPLMLVRVGAERLPRFEVTWRLPDGTSGSVTTELVRLRVRPRLINEQDPRLGALPDPVSVVTTNWALIWGLTLLGSALLAALLTVLGVFVYRNRIVALTPAEPPPPANVAAFAKLEHLLGADMPNDARYAAITDVLRWYLGERYGFDGLETTTVEMRRSLDGADLGEVSIYEVSQLLEETDLVKFARMTPGEGEARAKAATVKRMVEATWQEPDPEEAEEEFVRLEPASLRERTLAGAVDFGIAFLAGTLTATTAWRVWGAEWAWLGLVVYAFVMLVRDLGVITSPGKLSQALIVVSRDEEQSPATAGQCIGRNLLLALPLGAPIEALMLLYHPLNVRIGEIWSGTEVVRRPAATQRHGSTAAPSGASKELPAAGGAA